MRSLAGGLLVTSLSAYTGSLPLGLRSDMLDVGLALAIGALWGPVFELVWSQAHAISITRRRRWYLGVWMSGAIFYLLVVYPPLVASVAAGTARDGLDLSGSPLRAICVRTEGGTVAGLRVADHQEKHYIRRVDGEHVVIPFEAGTSSLQPWARTDRTPEGRQTFLDACQAP